MAYRLVQLAAGSYDLELDGELIGGVVRMELRDRDVWFAELLKPLPPPRMPTPFIALEHEFPSFGAVLAWLGHPEVRSRA
jgi:hypothetical protein